MFFPSNANIVTICSVLLWVLYLSKGSSGVSKYSEKVNAKTDFELDNEDAPFRMKKVNLLWSKAKKVLSDQKLADLYADLRIHDKDEAVLKKLKGDNADRDGKKEAQVLESYKYIMEYYGLDDFYKANLDNEIPMKDHETKKVYFEDSKLQSMWRRAEKSGFSDEDLKTLKEEFWHQQMKLNEFHFMRRELDAQGDPEDNEIDSEESKVNMSPEEKKEKMQRLKKHNMDVKEGYLRLEHLATNLPRKEPDFKDYRVQKMWSLAKKTNWSEEELDGFKEELKHFEHRLSKQDYYQEQFDLTRDALRPEMKEGGEYPEKLVHLKEKTDHVKQKVKKLHSHMKTRLEKALRHTEL